MYLVAEAVDLLVSQAWEYGGTPCANSTPETSDVLEHNLAKLAAQVACDVTGDAKMRDEMTTCRPPPCCPSCPSAEAESPR